MQKIDQPSLQLKVVEYILHNKDSMKDEIRKFTEFYYERMQQLTPPELLLVDTHLEENLERILLSSIHIGDRT